MFQFSFTHLDGSAACTVGTELSGADLLQYIECAFQYDSLQTASPLDSSNLLPVHSVHFSRSFIFQCLVMNSLFLSELINRDMIVFNYELSQLPHSTLSHSY